MNFAFLALACFAKKTSQKRSCTHPRIPPSRTARENGAPFTWKSHARGQNRERPGHPPGRLTSATSSLVDSQHPANLVSNISYGPFGVTSDSLGNGISESFGYAARGALSAYTAGTAYSFSLGLTSDYNIVSANDSGNGNWSYG